jgi:hypothetical protein
MTKDEFGALQTRARRRAFIVAGVADLDLLNDTSKASDNALAEGTTFEAFLEEVGTKLYNAWGGSGRLETIFLTNTLPAYGAGRWRQLPPPTCCASGPTGCLTLCSTDAPRRGVKPSTAPSAPLMIRGGRRKPRRRIIAAEAGSSR